MNLKQNNGLYVHIPFCGTICHYCDFVKFIYHEGWINAYLESLSHNLLFFNVPRNLKTIYIGGGTPTSLSAKELTSLLEMLAPYAKEVIEYTVEANIENLTREKLEILKKYGVNRLSIGVQTTNDARLKALNRMHTYEEIKQCIKVVKEVGFNNFSVDLIYGLPGQNINDVAIDLENILKLESPHLSLYALTVEPNTVAGIKNWPVPEEETSRAMYELILKTLRENGYSRYEVSNFAKNGFESVHNKLYWQNKEYYAIGLGASGYVNGERYKIEGGLTKYLKGEMKVSREVIDISQKEEEFLLLHLRLAEGFSLNEYKETFGQDFLVKYEFELQQLFDGNLLEVKNGRVYALDEGVLLLDYILRKLL